MKNPHRVWFGVMIALVSAAASGVAGAITVDLRRSQSVLEQQSVDVQREQIADWVVLALLQDRAPPAVAAATYDRPPVRTAWMDSILDQPYGSVRAVAISNDEAWIVAPADAPDLRTLVGRQADQLLAGTAVRPKRIQVFLYRTSADDWSVAVDDPLEFDAGQVWGAPFDYLTASITEPAQIGAWLGTGRDLAELRQVADGVVLGGRQLCPADGLKFGLQDVATIVSARLQMDQSADKQTKRLEELLKEANEPARAFNELVAVANKGIAEANRGDGAPTAATEAEFRRRAVKLASDLGISLNVRALTDIGQWKDVTGTLSDTVDKKREQLQSAAAEEIRKGGIQPGDPGFSLDPLLDVERLRKSASAAAANPSAPVLQAIEIWRKHSGDEVSQRPRLAWRAMDLLTEVAADLAEEEIDPVLSAQADTLQRVRRLVNERAEASQRGDIAALDAAQRALAESATRLFANWKPPVALGETAAGLAAQLPTAATRIQAEEALWTVRSVIQSERSSSVVTTALTLLLADAEVQCARYDGALDGSEVGMTLFYTDTIAKMWAALDYAQTAPVNAVPGLPTLPRLNGFPLALRSEFLSTPATRMWFGARESAAIGKPDAAQGLLFPALYARVFAKGSEGGFRVDEAVPNEASRQVFDWWDQHFLDIARYEPQYERLNQIMKWSLVSIWMARSENFRSVEAWDALAGSKTRNWDSWRAANPNLKFRTPLKLAAIPPLKERGLECFPLFRSRPFHRFKADSNVSYIEGGVSLVEKGKVENQLATPIPGDKATVPYRRSALRDDTGSRAVNSKETAIERWQLPDGERIVLRPTAEVPMRSGTLNLKPQDVSLAVARRGDVLELESGVSISNGSIAASSVRVTKAGDTVRIDADTGALGRIQRALEETNFGGVPGGPGLTVYTLNRGSNGYLVRLDGNAQTPRPADWFFVGPGLSASADSAVSWSGREIHPLAGQTEVNEKILGYRYQVLTAKNGGILRDLRNDAPPSAATTATVLWNNPSLPRSVRRAEGGELYLERLADPLLTESFRDLVEQEGLTASALADIQTRAGSVPVQSPSSPIEALARRISSGSPEEVARAMAQSSDVPMLVAARERAREQAQMSQPLLQELLLAGVPETLHSEADALLRQVLRNDTKAFEDAVTRVDDAMTVPFLRGLARMKLTSAHNPALWSVRDSGDRLVLQDGQVLTLRSIGAEGVKSVATGPVDTRDQGSVYVSTSGGSPVFAPAATTLRFELSDVSFRSTAERLREATGNDANILPDLIEHQGTRFARERRSAGHPGGGHPPDNGSSDTTFPIYLGTLVPLSSAKPVCPLPQTVRKAS